MSKINDLIKELCPNGVEKVSLGSLMSRKKEKNFENSGIGTVYSVTKDSGIVKSDDLHDFNVYSSDLSNYYILRLNEYAYNPARLNIGSIARLKEDNPGLVSPMYIVFELDSSKIDYEYYEHLLFSNKVFNDMCSFVEQGARFRFDYKNWDKVIIDLPPLCVQKEIVNILNKFKELENELHLELEARKSQYEFWRSKLLNKKSNKYKKYNITEICTSISAGGDVPEDTIKGISKPQDDYKYPVISNGVGDNAIYGFSKNYRVDVQSCVTIAARGTIGYHEVRYGKFTPIIRLITLIPDEEIVSAKYLNYALYGHEFKPSGGSIPQLTTPTVKQLDLMIPPIEEQNRVVSILDKFNELVNDITVGIPAEIKLRRQQYEYYRNKLLSFEELSVNE